MIVTLFCLSCTTQAGNSPGIRLAAPGSMAPTANKNTADAEMIKQAQKIISTGLTSTDLTVKDKAAGMMRYLPAPDAYPVLSRLLTEYFAQQTTGDMPAFIWSLLASLRVLNPDATLQLLLANQDIVLERFSLFRFFSIIGFEKIPLFDNLFYYQAMQEGTPGEQPALPVILAELFLATKEKKYGDVLRFYDYRSFTSGELLFVYDYFRTRGLPVDKITLTLQYLAGNLGRNTKGVRKSGKSPGLEDILYQALLFRLGLAPIVYNKLVIYTGTEIAEEALKKYGIRQEVLNQNQNLGHFTFSPYFLTLDACAAFYAGVPDEPHYRTLVDNFSGFAGSPLQTAFVRVILDSPDNSAKEKAISFLAAYPDNTIRALIFTSIKNKMPEITPAWLLSALERESDIQNRAILLEIIGNTKQDRYLPLLQSALTSPEPLIAVSAAGSLLNLQDQGNRNTE